MDDTNQSNKTVEAGANRKRRSSILKQQRAPRAPFSELEFHVTTPTDAAKSRRVSFSRRTGVAEFATNEATTTWKNFYEEHNKTLESSGNESEVNPPRSSVGHISKALFDQHFQDAEEIDLDDGKDRGIDKSINLEKFTSTTTVKSLQFNEPLRNIDMSLLPDQQSRIFGDVFCVSEVGEVTDRISVNFSNIQPIIKAQHEIKDDLDEIEKDLKKCHSNDNQWYDDANKQGAGLYDGKDDSEYLELDFNTTNVCLKTEESDMSITDTIHSPKVQAIPNSNSTDKKVNQSKDWVADKENILVVNPYVAPKESVNFAINEEPHKVLVFDGKRLTVQEDESKGNEADYRGTLLPNSIPDRTPVARKTIVLNVNDDLPNVSATASMRVKGINVNQTLYNSADVSTTRSASTTDLQRTDKKTIVFDNDVCDLSITEAVATKVILPLNEKRKTIIYESDSGEISMTEALSANIILPKQENVPQRRQTILYGDKETEDREISTEYEDKEYNISMTEAVRGNIVFTNKETKDKEISTDYVDNEYNISMTEAVRGNIVLTNKETKDKEISTDYVDNECNISMTEAVRGNIVLTNKETKDKEISTDYVDNECNISMTEAVRGNIVFTNKKTEDKEISANYEHKECNISITEAVRGNIVLTNKETGDIDISTEYELKECNNSITEAARADIALTNKKTIDKDISADISVTKCVPTNIILSAENYFAKNQNKEIQTIVYDEENCDISVTQTVPTNVALTEVTCQTQLSGCTQTCTKISYDEANSTNDVFAIEQRTSEKRKTIVYEKDSGDVSITLAVPSNLIVPEKQISIVYDNKTLNICSNANLDTGEVLEKSIVYEDETDSISVKKALHTSIILTENNVKNKGPGYVYDLNTSSVVFGNTSYINAIRASQGKNMIHKNTEYFCNQGSQYDQSFQLEMTRSDSRNTLIDKSGCILKAESDITKSDENSMQSEGILFKNIEKDLESTNHLELNKTCDLAADTTKKAVELGQLNLSQSSNLATEASSDCNEAPNVMQDILVFQTDIHRENQNDVTIEKNIVATNMELENENNIKKGAEPLETIKNDNPGNITTSDCKTNEDPKKSILDDLLDMTTESEGDMSLSAKGITNFVNLKDPPEVIEPGFVKPSEIMESEIIKPTILTIPIPNSELDNSQFMSIDHMTETNNETDKKEMHKSIVSKEMHSNELKSNERNVIIVNQSTSKQFSELEQYKPKTHEKVKKYDSSFCRTQKLIDANTTKDLLELLSHFTDSDPSSTENVQDKNEEKCIVEDKGVTCDIRLSIGDKIDLYERRRASFVPRQSIVFSRENLLQNISMAKEILCSTESSTPEQESEDDPSSDTAVEEEHLRSPKKSVRMSVEVVKQLNFDDSMTDSSTESNKPSLLKKITYMDEDLIEKDNQREHSKAHVIPTYLKDVTDNIKSLMTDLVKPLHDDIPFDSERNTRTCVENPSTCSLQVQANLVTSSQVDLQEESCHSVNPSIDAKDMESVVTRDNTSDRHVHHMNPRPCAENVVQFDPNNPLNNILIPINFGSAKRENTRNYSNNDSTAYHYPNDNQNYHVITKFEKKNEPAVSYSLTSSISTSESSSLESEKPAIEFNKSNSISASESSSLESEKPAIEFNKSSISTSESSSLESEKLAIEFNKSKKTSETNTTDSMLPNKALLESYSSLTVVDEKLGNHMDIETNTQSPIKSIDAMLNIKKRVHSPSPIKVVSCTNSPHKPAKKIPKQSISLENVLPGAGEVAAASDVQLKSPNRSKSHKCSNQVHDQSSLRNKPVLALEPWPILESKSPPMQQPEPLVPLRNKSPDYNDLKSPEKPKLSPLPKAPTIQLALPPLVKSLTRPVSPQLSKSPVKFKSLSQGSKASKRGRRSPVELALEREEAKKSLKSLTWTDDQRLESEASEDVQVCELHRPTGDMRAYNEVDQNNILFDINALPFVKSREVVWEKINADTWTFSLCERQMVIKVRVAPEILRPSTPVVSTNIDLDCAAKDAVSTMRWRFAAESIQYYASVRCACTADVPSLLRRAVSVTRVSDKWVKAMHAAYLHLAYDLTEDGYLTLNVANLPLRLVWRMSMRLDMVVNAEHDMLIPAATDVLVEPTFRLTPSDTVSKEDVKRITAPVKKDWGHVPKTLWKLFKFLKNKRGDAMFTGL